MLLLGYLIFMLSASYKFAFGDEITVVHSPDSLRFSSADLSEIRSSTLDDLYAASLGYTPKDAPPPVLTVTCAFCYPKGLVVFEIESAVPIKIEGISYNLLEDSSLADSYDQLKSLIGVRMQRPIHFQNIDASDLIKDSMKNFILKSDFLDEDKAVDRAFLREMKVLPTLVDDVSNKSSIASAGQDIVFVRVQSFAPLVKEYGEKSEQVEKASVLLRSSLMNAIDSLEKFYGNSLLAIAVKHSSPKAHVRKIRAVPFGDDDTDPLEEINLAYMYSSDYPVVFNIVLILSILLIITLLAVSVSIAFMDPGRDSIIYRMTNPRMKKDQ